LTWRFVLCLEGLSFLVTAAVLWAVVCLTGVDDPQAASTMVAAASASSEIENRLISILVEKTPLVANPSRPLFWPPCTSDS
jgi:hypothetical protein